MHLLLLVLLSHTPVGGLHQMFLPHDAERPLGSLNILRMSIDTSVCTQQFRVALKAMAINYAIDNASFLG